MLRRRTASEAVFFLALLMALLVAGRQRLFHDPGTFWHTRVGDAILTTGRFPVSDTWTFTRAGKAWIAQQWLGECVMAALDRMGGLDALLLAAATVISASFTLTFSRLVRSGVLWPLAGLICGVAVAAGACHFLVRPHLITIACSAWLYGLMSDLDAGRIRSSRLAWLPVVFVLWANTHGGVLGGFATLFLIFGLWTVQAPRAKVRALPLVVVGLVCAGTALLNPYGWALPRVWLALMRSSVLPQIIQEHAPPRIDSPEFWMLTGLVVIFGITMAGVPVRRFRLIWLVPVVWAALAYSRIRHGPIFAVMAVMAIADMLPVSRWKDWFAARGSDLISTAQNIPRTRTAGLVPLLVVAAALGVQATGLRVPIIGRHWAQIDPDWWPVAATDELRRALAARPDEHNVFNDMLFGGYLIRFAPEARIYIDDRCELFGDAGLLAYIDLMRDLDRLMRQLPSQNVHFALLKSGSAFDAAFRQSDWIVRHRDSTATLYERPETPIGISASPAAR